MQFLHIGVIAGYTSFALPLLVEPIGSLPPCVVKNAVLRSRGHRAGAHAMRRDRLPDRPGKSCSGSSLLKDLPDSIRIEPACVDCAPAIDLPEDWPCGDRCLIQPATRALTGQVADVLP
jgi:hypothetical protein